MTTLLIIGAVLACFGLLFASAEYLVRRIERIGEPVRRVVVERMDGTVKVYWTAPLAYPLPDDPEAYEAPLGRPQGACSGSRSAWRCGRRSSARPGGSGLW